MKRSRALDEVADVLYEVRHIFDRPAKVDMTRLALADLVYEENGDEEDDLMITEMQLARAKGE